MKNYLILLFLILFGSQSYAQSYIPMLDEDNEWVVDLHWSDYFGNDGIISYPLSINGTTEIGGETYQNIESQIGNCYFREDNGVIYKYSYYLGDEFILYDFTLEVGEFYNHPYTDDLCPFQVTNLPFNNTSWEVINVSTQFIAGEDRKVIEFDPNDTFLPEIWIEGIGSTRGLNPGGDSFHEATFLVCFTRDGITTYFNEATSCDNTTLGLDDLSEENTILYPNPVTDRSILHFSSDSSVNHIKIFDISGRLVKEEQISKDYYLIDAMQYPSGLYFYQVFSKGALITSDKFIVK